tara:strand:- start:1383 stop:1733 length:351 start_codon:yes stop_codon:yes gene_type:complete
MTEDEALLEIANSHKRFIEGVDYQNEIDRIISKGIADIEYNFDWKMLYLEKNLQPIESNYIALKCYLMYPNDKFKSINMVDHVADRDVYYDDKYIIAIRARIKLREWFKKKILWRN